MVPGSKITYSALSGGLSPQLKLCRRILGGFLPVSRLRGQMPRATTMKKSNTTQPKGVIVIGGHINGLGILRSFSALNIRTAVILTKGHDLAQHSRCIAAYGSALELAQKPEMLVELLERQAVLWKGWALFPVNDEALAALEQCRPYIESDYPIIAPPGELTRYFLDKELMLGAARDAGIPLPKCYGPAEAATECSGLSFPVIVKPIASFPFFDHFGFKVLVARNPLELKDAVSRVQEAGKACRIFDVVPGPDSNIYCQCLYMDASGTPRAELLVRKIRQSPPFFGVARVAEVVPDNALLREASIELLRRLRFRGIAVAEYKLDPRDGTFRFLEVNGRSVIYNSLLRRAGMNLAALAWADQVEGRPQTAKPVRWPGVWINLHADLLYSALRGGEEGLRFKDFLAPYIRPKIEAVWSLRDPMPFLVQWSRTVRDGFQDLSVRFRKPSPGMQRPETSSRGCGQSLS